MPEGHAWKHRTAKGIARHKLSDQAYSRTPRRAETQAAYEATLKGKMRQLRRYMKNVQTRIAAKEHELQLLLESEGTNGDEG